MTISIQSIRHALQQEEEETKLAQLQQQQIFREARTLQGFPTGLSSLSPRPTHLATQLETQTPPNFQEKTSQRKAGILKFAEYIYAK